MVYGGYLPPSPLNIAMTIKIIRYHIHAPMCVMASSRNAYKAENIAFIELKSCKLLKSRVFYQ